ncbi:MAG: twitching motility protein PilT [Actinobacteria bacterium]|nr:twitching motility protein PilT [Actinomycetota bacterium]
MSLVLDAGALVAVERRDRELIAVIKRERQHGRAPVTHGGVIGQVWRGRSGRQAILARLLPAVDVHPLDDALGRRAGVLLGSTGGADVIDAAVVLLAADGDEIVTSDPRDLRLLAEAAATQVDLIPV